ncbi:MAG: methionyl-tRNA formyltransferase [Phycisphaerales bacterium]|nr:MAG: methionyl-tRNA formyltransferase [Phycisphaerales bacterium]
MRIVYFGSGAFGLPTLEMLARRHELAAVVTQPDKPAGRGRTPRPTPVGQWAAQHLPSVAVLKPQSVNEAPVRDQLHALDAQAWVVIAFGQKLGRRLLGDRLAINLHASLLPRWRGAAPIHAAILAGDPTTGLSVITLADEMDAGLVLAQSTRAIDPSWTAGQLHDLLAQDGPALVQQVLERAAAGSLQGVQQDPARVTYAPRLTRADGWIDLAQTAEECRRRVHGLTPWPGVSVRIGPHTVKLLHVAEAPHRHQATPGMLLDPAGLVACGQGTSLTLLEVQPAGRRAMDFASFARGHRLHAGQQITPEHAPCTRSGT